MKKFLRKFAQNTSGATAIEYGLIAAMVAMGIVAGASAMGDNLTDTFNKTAEPLEIE
jgi:pilus assembly protein Flp/PilA